LSLVLLVVAPLEALLVVPLVTLLEVLLVMLLAALLVVLLFEASCFELPLFLGLMGDFDSNEWSLQHFQLLQSKLVTLALVLLVVAPVEVLLFEASCFELPLFLGLMGDLDSNEWSLQHFQSLQSELALLLALSLVMVLSLLAPLLALLVVAPLEALLVMLLEALVLLLLAPLLELLVVVPLEALLVMLLATLLVTLLVMLLVMLLVTLLEVLVLEASCFELPLFLGLMGDFDSNEWSLQHFQLLQSKLVLLLTPC
jgi:hypothetical protein